MATATPSADQTANLLQNLNLDSQTKTSEVSDATKKTSVYQYGSANLGNVTNGQLHQGNEWDDYSRYANSEGMLMSSAVYGDGAPVMYHNGYAYPTYGPYSPAATPIPTMGNDGQIYGPQHYQYPSYFHATTTSGPMISSSVAPPQDAFSTSTVGDQKALSLETSKSNSNRTVNNGVAKANSGPVPFKPTHNNSLFTPSNVNGGTPASGFAGPRFGFDGSLTGSRVTSSFSKSKNSSFQRKQNYYPNSHYVGFHNPSPGMGSTDGFMNGMHPNGFYGHYGGAYRSGIGYGSTGYGSRANGRGWPAADGKYRPRGRGYGYGGYGNENVDDLNELNRGPRSKGPKNQRGFVPNTCADNVQNGPSDETSGEEKAMTSVCPGLEEFNKADLAEDYADAKFFIIKSYSEDDIHKSIKYNVWASTPNGNKKLEASYQEAQQLSGGCPVFLFFSVNTSGQFVGLAEMVGPVDFDKTLGYWQQDKWTGCFPVKWHIVKDVPNNLLKHIILENNENKPVTNSRDTQEVKLEHGLKMIKIFKGHSSKTSILDDFGFYEARQKIIQEKKEKQQQLQKLVWDGKPKEEKKEIANGSQQVSLEVASDLSKEPTSTQLPNSDHHENGLAAKGGDVAQGGKSVVSEKIANGLANGC
ncbi:YTH domain-containing protein ECT4-like isoform X2 [Tripterygium wilfordii]|uniref:YTH domain-containing protein ECT4-like isoform X2 n=1 Tax=Tripterygium wilfordii TaxID=458696 RepID=UPI0018F8351B|nr:YTH domain-containing protein ECT4-like isoform X2 [Tripterygium wilfordii]